MCQKIKLLGIWAEQYLDGKTSQELGMLDNLCFPPKAHLLFYCRLDQMAYRVVKYVEANKLNMVLQYINYVWAVPISFHTFLIVFIVVVVSTKTTVVQGKLTVRVTGVQPRI